MSNNGTTGCLHPSGRTKSTFRSKAAARKTAKLLRGGRYEHLAGLPWSAYRCPDCGYWHLTTLADHSQKKGMRP